MIQLLVCLLLVGGTQTFQPEYELRGAKPLGMGNAGHGLADDNSALDYNPAAMSSQQRYGVEALYQWLQDSQSSFRASILDSKTSMVGTGISYVRDQLETNGEKTETRDNYNIAISFPVTPYAAFGVLLRFLEFQDKYLSTLGYGVIIKPASDYLTLGATFHDATPINGKNPGLMKRIATGISSRLGDAITIVADSEKETGSEARDETDYSVGGEISLMQQFKLRGGYMWRNIEGNNYYTLGIGWMAPRVSFDYGFRQNVREAQGQAHCVSLTIYPF